MKNKIKILIVLLVLLIVVTLFILLRNKNTIGVLYDDGKLKLGDVVGYKPKSDDTIKWQVIGKDSDGNILLLGDKVDKVDFGWGTTENDYYSLEKGEEFYLNFVDKANQKAKDYTDGTGAISAHALNLEEVANLCNIKLVDKNSEQKITGTFPGEGNTTKSVVDNYNEFIISKEVIGDNIYNMLFSINYYNLATTGINIANDVAYFNVYVIFGDGIQGMEKYSTNNGEISKNATVYVNYFDYSRDFRPVVVIDSNTKLKASNSGVWDIK